MKSSKPVYLSFCIAICSLLADLCAAIHFCLLSSGLCERPPCLQAASTGTYKTLQNIWCTRIARRLISILVRSPLRSSTLRLVNFTITLPANSGCIILICHTPWKRLLVQWCIENDFGLIIAHGKWRCKKGDKVKREAQGYNEVRSLVKHLKQQGRIIMTGDIFNQLNNYPVKFLNTDLNAGLLPTRLARIAQVPLIAAIPVFKDGTLNINQVPPSACTNSQADPLNMIQHFLFALEKEIKHNPSVCNYFDK